VTDFFASWWKKTSFCHCRQKLFLPGWVFPWKELVFSTQWKKNMPTLPSTQFLVPERSHTANDILIGSTIQALLVVVIT